MEGLCYYERHKPTATEVYPKEDNIKHDQYTKAFGQIGPVPSTEGRLMTVVEQVVIFEQNILRTLKGLSPLCILRKVTATWNVSIPGATTRLENGHRTSHTNICYLTSRGAISSTVGSTTCDLVI